MRTSRMFAALAAALVAAVLSLGGASLVIAGQPDGKGDNGNANGQAQNNNGNGNAYGHDDGTAAPAPVAAPAPSGGGKSQGNANGHSEQRHSKPAPAPKQHAPASKPAPAPAPAPTGGGSHSTATSGPGNSSQGCDGSHNSNTGHGANHSGPYDNSCNGSPSGNGNGNGKATGKPCAGCVGNADDKNPKGQMPNGSDHNAGYECDRNHGIGRSNPAHTGCTTSTETTPPPSGDNHGGDNSGGGNEGEHNGCPDAAKLSTSLTKLAALALKAAAAAHPELTKLSDLAASKANAGENCGQGSDNGHDNGKITICHATGSATNPYVEITISVNGLNGHGDHQDDRDIIPAPAEGCPTGQTTPPAGGEQPGNDHPGNDNGHENDNGKITICHATGSATNPYVEITISVNGLNGHGDHQDDRDIIPAPAEGCPTGQTTPPAGGEQPGGNTPPPAGITPPPAGITPPPAGTTPPPEGTSAPTTLTQPATETPAGQAVLGERVSGSSGPAKSTAPANDQGGQEVLGENASGGSAPAAAQAARPATNQGGSLPFTGTDAMLVLFLGCLMLIGGVAVQRLTTRRSS